MMRRRNASVTPERMVDCSRFRRGKSRFVAGDTFAGDLFMAATSSLRYVANRAST
jgi:hypothetical protein